MKKTLLISFKPEQVAMLREESNRLGSSIASIVRQAVTNYFQEGS